MNMEPNVSVAGAELQRRIEEALESRLEYQSGGHRSSVGRSGWWRPLNFPLSELLRRNGRWN